MTWFFTPHARERFKERYGFRPSIRELSAVATACSDGTALPMRTSADGGTAFCCTVRATRVYPIVKDETIITFLPPDFFFASAAKAHRREVLHSAGCPARPKEVGKGIKSYLRRQPYKRDRTPPAKLLDEA